MRGKASWGSSGAVDCEACFLLVWQEVLANAITLLWFVQRLQRKKKAQYIIWLHAVDENVDIPQKKRDRSRSVAREICILSSFAQLPAVDYRVSHLSQWCRSRSSVNTAEHKGMHLHFWTCVNISKETLWAPNPDANFPAAPFPSCA